MLIRFLGNIYKLRYYLCKIPQNGFSIRVCLIKMFCAGLPSAFQQKQINELHSTLNREKLTAVIERNRVKMAEKAVAEKDHEVNELVAKLMQYERGKMIN